MICTRHRCHAVAAHRTTCPRAARRSPPPSRPTRSFSAPTARFILAPRLPRLLHGMKTSACPHCLLDRSPPRIPQYGLFADRHRMHLRVTLASSHAPLRDLIDAPASHRVVYTAVRSRAGRRRGCGGGGWAALRRRGRVAAAGGPQAVRPDGPRRPRSAPARGSYAPFAFPTVDRCCTAGWHRRAGRVTARFGGSRRGHPWH
jgi:hypothetical protein